MGGDWSCIATMEGVQLDEMPAYGRVELKTTEEQISKTYLIQT